MPTPDSIFTAAARRHASEMARVIAPFASRIERRCAAVIAGAGYKSEARKALLKITPAALVRLESVDRFLEEVEYQGRRLAKCNVPPEEVRAAVFAMERQLDPILGGRFEPSREQIRLGMRLAIERAFYQVREAEVQALVAMQSAVAEACDQDDLLRRVTSILVKAFHARAGRILVAAKPPPALRRPRFIERGEKQDRLIADVRMRRECRSFWSYPLGDSVVVQLGFPVRYPWLPREQTLLKLASGVCSRAFERARLQNEIRRLESSARQAEQDERRRIGRELHDETAQALLLLRLRLEMWERKAPDAVAGGLKDCRILAENAVVELRRIIAALSPTALERLGLRSALGHLIGQFRKLYPASVRIRIQGNVDAIARHLQEGIYRTAQECLQNIAKHSRANTVNVSLHVSDRGIRLRVTDNGAGFTPDAANGKRKSFGIRGMRERAAFMGGVLSLETAPGAGTTVTLEVPQIAALVAGNGKNSRLVD